MSMMSVRPVLMSGGEPSQAAMRMAVQANALAGLQGCRGPHCRGLAGMGDWGDTAQQLAVMGTDITGRILLNKYQAKSVQTNPYGTTVYYPPGGSAAVGAGGGVASSGIDSSMLLLGGGALVVLYLVMSKR